MLPASRDGTDSSGPPGSVSRYGGRDLTSDRPSGRPALFEPSARSRTGSSELDSASSGVGSVRSHPGSASDPPYREAIHTRWVTSSRFDLQRTRPPSTAPRFPKPDLPSVASPPADASRFEEPKSPSRREHPRPFPGVRSKRFGPLRSPTVRTTRRADCSSLCEVERFHP